MKALLCKEWGLPETLVVEEVDDLKVEADHDVVIDVHAAAVNFPDALIIQKLYQFQPQLPFSPGGECAGIVREAGKAVGHLTPGMRVMSMTGWGSFAEQVKADGRGVLPLPDDMDLVTASAFIMTYGTSYHALKDRGELKAGETLLVLGASGGVGLAAIEIGKALGAKVIAAASTDEKLAICKEHGGDEVINYSTEDLKLRIRELTDNKGADVIYDPVGGDYTEAAFRSIAWRGRFLVVGFANGEIPKLPLNLTLLKGANICGVFWGDFARREAHNFLEDCGVLFNWLKEGTVNPLIAGTFSLEDAPKAIRALMDRKVSGKLVVVPERS